MGCPAPYGEKPMAGWDEVKGEQVVGFAYGLKRCPPERCEKRASDYWTREPG